MCVFPTSVPPASSISRSIKGALLRFTRGEKSRRNCGFPQPVLNPATSMLSLTATETFSSAPTTKRLLSSSSLLLFLLLLLLFLLLFHVSNSSGRTKHASRGGDVFCSLESDDNDAFIASATIGTSAAAIAGKPRGFVRPRRDVLLMCSQKVVTKKKRDETDDVSSKRVKRGGVHTNFNNIIILISSFIISARLCLKSFRLCR